jgi:hypothetical protein
MISCRKLEGIPRCHPVFASFATFFENAGWRASVSSSRTLDWVIPAWSAGIQFDIDVSGGIRTHLMDAGHPCRHDEALHFHLLWGVRKIMNHFVVDASPQETL